MIKAIAINGSPRKGWNTDMLLQPILQCEFLLLDEMLSDIWIKIRGL